jgi:hypothetical protein
VTSRHSRGELCQNRSHAYLDETKEPRCYKAETEKDEWVGERGYAEYANKKGRRPRILSCRRRQESQRAVGVERKQFGIAVFIRIEVRLRIERSPSPQRVQRRLGCRFTAACVHATRPAPAPAAVLCTPAD